MAGSLPAGREQHQSRRTIVVPTDVDNAGPASIDMQSDKPAAPPTLPEVTEVDDPTAGFPFVAGDRLGSYGFGAGLSGLLLALAPFGHPAAWVLVVGALVLGLTGYARYPRGGATNHDVALVGLALGWVGFVVLLVEASVALTPATYSYGP